MSKLKDRLNEVERYVAPGSTVANKYHLNDAIISVRHGVDEISEFLQEIGDTNQLKKFMREWTKLKNQVAKHLPKATYKKGSFK